MDKVWEKTQAMCTATGYWSLLHMPSFNSQLKKGCNLIEFTSLTSHESLQYTQESLQYAQTHILSK